MKKNNFYFITWRCCAFLLPVLMFLSGTTLKAYDFANDPFHGTGTRNVQAFTSTSALLNNAMTMEDLIVSHGVSLVVNAHCNEADGRALVRAEFTGAGTFEIVLLDGAGASTPIAAGASPAVVSQVLTGLLAGNYAVQFMFTPAAPGAVETIRTPFTVGMDCGDIKSFSVYDVVNATCSNANGSVRTYGRVDGAGVLGLKLYRNGVVVNTVIPLTPTATGTEFVQTIPGLAAGNYSLELQFTPTGGVPYFVHYPFTVGMDCGEIKSFSVYSVQNASCDAANGSVRTYGRVDGAGVFGVKLYRNGAVVNTVIPLTPTATGTEFVQTVSGLPAGNYSLELQFTPTGGAPYFMHYPFTVGMDCGAIRDLGLFNLSNAQCDLANGSAIAFFRVFGGNGSYVAGLTNGGTVAADAGAVFAGVPTLLSLTDLPAGPNSLIIIFTPTLGGPQQIVAIPFTVTKDCGVIRDFSVTRVVNAQCELANGSARTNARFEGEGFYSIFVLDNQGNAPAGIVNPISAGNVPAAGLFVPNIPITGLLAGNYYVSIAFTPTGGITQNIRIPFTVGKDCGEIKAFAVFGVTNATCNLADGNAFTAGRVEGQGSYEVQLRNNLGIVLRVLAGGNTTLAGGPGGGVFGASFGLPTSIAASLTGLMAGNYSIAVVFTPTGGTLRFLETPFTIGNAFNPNRLTCIGGSPTSPGVNISLGANCFSTITASQILVNGCGTIIDADFIVTVQNLGLQTIAQPITRDLIGQVLRVEVEYAPGGVRSGTRCWGYVKIEDKTAPVIRCNPSVVIGCDADPKNLCITGQLGVLADANDPRNRVTCTPKYITNDMSVLECSKYDQIYSDRDLYNSACVGLTAGAAAGLGITLPTVPAGTQIIRVIERTWTAKDIYGNISNPCVQRIFITKTNLPTVTIRNVNLPCTVISDRYNIPAGKFTVGGVEYDATPVFVNAAGVVVNAGAFCGVAINRGPDRLLRICGGLTADDAASYKVIRTYEIVDMCANVMIATLTQIIIVEDRATPMAKLTFDDFVVTNDGTYCFRENGMQMDADNKKTTRTTRSIDVLSTLVPTIGGNFTAAPITLTPLASSTMCNAAAVKVTLKGKDKDCGNGKVTYMSTDSRVTFTTGTATTGTNTITVAADVDVVARGLFMTNAGLTFTIMIMDECGNTINQPFTVNVSDNLSPNTVCKSFSEATLTDDGTVRVYAESLNNVSTDNCGIRRILVRRMTVAGSTVCADRTQIETPSCFDEFVDFSCDDTGDGVLINGKYYLQVVFRVVDFVGNYNDCMVLVAIIDKTKPTCTSPADKTVNCTGIAEGLRNLTELGTSAGNNGEATGYDNCGVIVVKDSVVALDNCKTGVITRNWTFTDCGGANSVKCTQKITVTGGSDFTVDFPDDVVAECISSAPSIAALKTQLLTPSNWNKTTINPATGLALGDGAILNRGCGVLAVEIKDDTLMAQPTEGYCMKILRKIRVIDWCKYNPNNDVADQNRNCYGMPVTGDIHSFATWRDINLGAWQNLDRSGFFDKNVNTAADHLASVKAAHNFSDANAALAAAVTEAQIMATPDALIGTIKLRNLKLYVGYTLTFEDARNAASLTKERRFRDADGLTGPGNDPTNFTHPFSYNDGIICYTQIIKIVDRTAPASSHANTTFCSYALGCQGTFTDTLRATDACLTNVSVSPLRFSWQVFKADGTTPVLKANGTTLSGIDPIFGATLDFGTYVVKYTVTDLCMNIAGPYVYTVTIKDCKTPTIICHDVSAELMWTGNTGNARGMVTVWATDLLASPLSDNCTSQGFLNSKLRAVRQSANPGNTFPTGSTSFDFNCADKGSVVPVQLWTIDSAGNADYCLSYVTVQDNLSSACTTTQARVNVAGAVRAEANQPVTAVTVSATAAGIVAGTATTTTTGDFTVNGLTAGQNLQIRAARANDNDKAVGITTYDIALISKHILDIDHLATPYKMIAADVNKDAAIDALDMLELRRFILHINPTLRGGVWRFIDKSYTFRNAANPFGEDFPEVINLLNVTSSTVTNFTAVKLGDVNDSYDATQVRGARSLTFNANDMNLTAGNEYSVAISAENFNALAFQGTFTFNGATVKSIKVGDLNNLTDANFGIFNNEVTTSWNGKAVATANVVTINFVATKSGKLSDMLTFGSAKTIAEANDAQGVAVNVGLKFNTGKVSGAEFALYQNTPNPVAQTTTIGFNMPKEGQAKLTIYNVEGKVLRTLNGDYKVGFNSIEVNKTELNATGILYYRLDTQDNSATRKMIIID